MKSVKNELWKRKSLIWNFALSDLKIRYRSSVLGFFWTILEPLLMLSVLYIVFTNIFKSQIDNFGMYILLGIIMWNMLTRGTEIGLNSIIARSHLVTQIYFPKEIPAISATITALLMTGLEFIVFGIFTVVFQFTPPVTIIFLPLVLLLEFILILGISLPLSVLSVRYRDIQFIWKVFLQAAFFLTPIFYKFEILPESFRKILVYSPMVQIMDMGHDVAIYNIIPSIQSVLIAVISTSFIMIIGYAIFRKAQNRIIEDL